MTYSNSIKTFAELVAKGMIMQGLDLEVKRLAQAYLDLDRKYERYKEDANRSLDLMALTIKEFNKK